MKAYAATDITVISATQAELSNNSIEDSEEALALIKGNSNDITKVNAVDELDWI